MPFLHSIELKMVESVQIVRHTKTILRSFTPLQLARSIHGFGIANVDDPSLYRQLCKAPILGLSFSCARR